MKMPLWRVTAEAPRALIDKAAAAAESVDPAPLTITHFEASKTTWALDLLYAEEVDLAALFKALAATDPDLADLNLHQGPLAEEDWVAKSLEGLKPIETSRFFVYGGHNAHHIPPGKIPVLVEAGEAFGTGHHGTTEGCLEALSRIDSGFRPARVLDLGTGTGILAIAAAKLWRARTIATDIDPIAVRVAEENVALNGVAAQVRCALAAGATHPAIHGAAPFDLVIANILAGPLRQLAGDIAPLVAHGGHLVLSGLFTEQAARVEGVYAGHHLPVVARLTYGEWVTLMCRKA